jgi:hypothetical protein
MNGKRKPHDLQRGGFSPKLYRRLEVFRKKYKYTCWHFDGELTFYDGQEPFGWAEYVKGSQIKETWKRLEAACAKEIGRQLTPGRR